MGALNLIVADLRRLFRQSARATDELECVLAVILAIAGAHVSGACNVVWAAFSAYMVMRSHILHSLQRGLLRVSGTVLGALGGWLLSYGWGLHPAVVAPAVALIGGTTIYAAIQSRNGYGWILGGVTFVMVLLGGITPSARGPAATALSRVAEVCIGCLACLLVSAISTATFCRARSRRAIAPTGDKHLLRAWQWNPALFRHVCHGAIALALLPFAVHWVAGDTLVQAGVTIMAALFVPGASLLEAPDVTRCRLRQRLCGALAGAVVGGALLYCSHSPEVLLPAMCLGLMVGRHIENSGLGFAYVGTQFSLALLVVLVPDRYESLDILRGVNRLAGCLVGLLILELIRIFLRRFR